MFRLIIVLFSLTELIWSQTVLTLENTDEIVYIGKTALECNILNGDVRMKENIFGIF